VATPVNARDEVLDRIRRAAASGPVTIPRDYRGAGDAAQHDRREIVDLFAERVDDYRASVHRAAATDAPDAVARILTAAGRRRMVIPPGIPVDLIGSADLERVTDDPPLTPEQLDEADGVITTCACAIATTGTIVLDHRDGQGRRALTLVPDYHLVVVRSDQVAAAVPDAVAALDPYLRQTWISGPSATSDIELQRVEGVHGPRTLEVLILD
jgi:L-lactate dehydrogenase complex protein LldG